MNQKLFRFFPLRQHALRLQNKCTFHLQNFNYCLPPKYTLNPSFVNNIRDQSSTTSSVQPNEEEGKENVDMVKFTFVTYKGKDIEVEAECGLNIMAIGVESEVFSDGICNGTLECTICHVYVEDEIANVFAKQSRREEDKLDGTKYLKPNSRLSCQLFATKKIEGARFQLPPPTKTLQKDEYPP